MVRKIWQNRVYFPKCLTKLMCILDCYVINTFVAILICSLEMIIESRCHPSLCNKKTIQTRLRVTTEVREQT